MSDKDLFVRAMSKPDAISGLSDHDLVRVACYAVALNEADAALMVGVEIGVREHGRDEARSLVNALSTRLMA